MFKYTNNEIVSSTKTTNGICPNCGSNEIDYYGMCMDTDFNGVIASQKCVCDNCGFEYDEWYRLVYDGFTADMNNDTHSFDTQGELA